MVVSSKKEREIMIRVTIWNEYRHEKTSEEVRARRDQCGI